MRRIAVLVLFSVRPAPSVYFVGEHVVDSRCTTARAAVLVDDWREVGRCAVVDAHGARLPVGSWCDFAQSRVGAHGVRIVGVEAAVHFLRLRSRQECEGCHQKSKKSFHDMVLFGFPATNIGISSRTRKHLL